MGDNCVDVVLRVLRELQQLHVLDRAGNAIGEVAHRILPSRRWQRRRLREAHALLTSPEAIHLRQQLAQGPTDTIAIRLLGLLDEAHRHAAPVLSFSNATPLEEAALRVEMMGLWEELAPARAAATGPVATRVAATAATRAAFPEPHGRKAARAPQAAILS